MAFITTVVLLICSILLYYVSTQRLEYKNSLDQSNFDFRICNRSAVPFYITSLELYPDPVQLGELIVLGVVFDLDKDVGVNRRVEVELNLRLKTDRGYTELCDIIGEEKCYYNDLCELLKTLMENNTCPRFMRDKYHNNCSCPFLKDKCNIGRVPLIIGVLPFQLRGTFDVTINLQE